MEDKTMFLGSLDIENDIIKQYLCTEIENDKKSIVRDQYILGSDRVIKRIGKNILTGNEIWRYDSETKTFAYYQENKFNENGLGKYDKMMSNYFRWQTFNITIKESMFQGNDKGEIMFKFYDGVEDVNVFKNWLRQKYEEGNPVEVYFALQYPVIMKMEKIYNWCYLKKMSREFAHISIHKSEDNTKGIDPILEIRNRTINRKK